MVSVLAEEVVLLDSVGSPIGTALKRDVHSAHTPFHLAFSCYLTRADGQVLVTRRSLSKQSWPGVWTNSFCGHPGPEEDMEGALRRRARKELGVELTDITAVLPDFRYRAVDASGVVENELCPVFTAHTSDPLAPDPDEVAEWSWVHPALLRDAVRATPFAFSPWLGEQLPQLFARSVFTPVEHS